MLIFPISPRENKTQDSNIMFECTQIILLDLAMTEGRRTHTLHPRCTAPALENVSQQTQSFSVQSQNGLLKPQVSTSNQKAALQTATSLLLYYQLPHPRFCMFIIFS